MVMHRRSREITEEEICEYLAKKAQRKAFKVADEKFVWQKKIERDVALGLPVDMYSAKAEKKKQRERMAEIAKLKKRRGERAIEKAKREEELAMLARERARAEFHDSEKEEEQQRPWIQESMVVLKPNSSEDNFLELKAKKAMGAMDEGDEVFGSGAEVVNLDDSPVPYRLRKPKYSNRVHSGYEWSKYNKTHYDYDNPPPKMVQGYKFNIFYPDLLDKTKAPEYTLEKDGSSSETCLIRFHAGPPYQDIAFRIVNKDWEHSHKMGFKSTFEQGILHLYFNFKRYRYRR